MIKLYRFNDGYSSTNCTDFGEQQKTIDGYIGKYTKGITLVYIKAYIKRIRYKKL